MEPNNNRSRPQRVISLWEVIIIIILMQRNLYLYWYLYQSICTCACTCTCTVILVLVNCYILPFPVLHVLEKFNIIVTDSLFLMSNIEEE